MKDIEWEAVSQSEVRICVLESGGFRDELQKMAAAKKMNGKSITVAVVESPNNCSTCDVLFIDELASKKKIKRVEGFKGLIVTSGFYDKSLSNVALLFHDNKLQFSINTDLCTKLGFRISSHLSSLANQKLIAP